MFLLKTAFRPRGRTAALVAAVAALVLVFVPAAQATGPRPFDRAFMTEMVSHHAMAVDMAEMALDKATHAELRETASEIVRTQTAEIREMRRWLRRWYGATVEPHMTHQDMRDMEELENATGGAFELRFMMLMTVHHTFAIERANIARRRARHRPVRRLAKAIVRAQNREIVQFRDWAVAWYAG
jgi:uncharacterized protein (DUF305 family)